MVRMATDLGRTARMGSSQAGMAGLAAKARPAVVVAVECIAWAVKEALPGVLAAVAEVGKGTGPPALSMGAVAVPAEAGPRRLPVVPLTQPTASLTEGAASVAVALAVHTGAVAAAAATRAAAVVRGLATDEPAAAVADPRT